LCPPRFCPDCAHPHYPLALPLNTPIFCCDLPDTGSQDYSVLVSLFRLAPPVFVPRRESICRSTTTKKCVPMVAFSPPSILFFFFFFAVPLPPPPEDRVPEIFLLCVFLKTTPPLFFHTPNPMFCGCFVTKGVFFFFE